MNVNCPHCNAVLDCDATLAGTTVACAQCGGKLAVPVPVAKVATVATMAAVEPAKTAEHEVMSGHTSILPYIPVLCVGVLLIAVYGIGILIIILALWQWASHKYVLTSKSLRIINGVCIKSETTVRIKDIRGIAIRRRLLDVLSGCGTLVVGTAATADAEIIIPHIRNVKAIQRLLNDYRDAEI